MCTVRLIWAGDNLGDHRRRPLLQGEDPDDILDVRSNESVGKGSYGEWEYYGKVCQIEIYYLDSLISAISYAIIKCFTKNKLDHSK